MLASYVHDFDPVIFKIWSLEPRWYGFAYLCGFIAAYFILIRLARGGMLRMPSERVPDLVLNACIWGVLLGGRLGYCLFYDTRLLGLMRNEVSGEVVFPYWGVFAVWRGGMAAHGGVLVTIITIIVFVWRNNVAADNALRTIEVEKKDKKDLTSKEAAALRKYSIVNIGDAACMVVPIGLFFGRIANFINGELYGHPSSVPWAVKFPTELINRTNNPNDPPQDIRAMQDLDSASLVTWAQERFPSLHIRGYMQGGMTDVIHQLQQGSGEAREAIRLKFAAMDSLPARHPSQLYEALLEGVLLFLIVWIIGRKWRRDGMAAGAFLTLYPVMRIIGEQFRVGDTPVDILGITLSKGVWYSVAMFVPGVIFWIYWIKKNQKAEWVPEPKKAKGAD
jgi:phosphatidylglycerol---prolipoprotein diacylglyceryl transferase